MTRQEIPVFKTREENVAYMNETLPIQESFDLIQRDLLIGGRVFSFYFVNGFTSEETMLKIMDALLKVKEEEMPEDVWEFANACIPYVEVEVLFDFDQILKSLLSGETCVFIDGYRACIVIDCRTYPVRSVEEPDKDKSLRGSRDGFVETLVYNTAMMRRRIRHPALIMEMMEVGDSSRTDVALCYMGDRVDKELLKNVRDKIRSVDTDDLRMNQQSGMSVQTEMVQSIPEVQVHRASGHGIGMSSGGKSRNSGRQFTICDDTSDIDLRHDRRGQ